jgi:hypothetical protein
VTTQGKDRRYIQFHHGSWYVVVGHREGGKVIKARHSLGTANLREAQKRRWPVVAELKARLASGNPSSAAHEEADAWRAALAAGDGGPDDPTPLALSDHLDAIRGDPKPLSKARKALSTSMTLSGNGGRWSSSTGPWAGQRRSLPTWTPS